MLWYYDISRRKFLKIMGLSTAGIALSSCQLKGVVPGLENTTGESDETVSMKQSIARAVHDAGADVVLCVPATGTAKIFDEYTGIIARGAPYSYNEEVAYTVAHGAGLSGRRSAIIIKAHGLAKAANSVIDSLTAGTTAGFVVIITFDKKGRHSDNIFDHVDFVKGTGIPFRIPESETIYQDIVQCFSWSEQLRLPVGILIDTDTLDDREKKLTFQSTLPSVSYCRDPLSHVLCPPLTNYQFQVLRAKLAGKGADKVKRPVPLQIPADLPPKWQEMISDYMPLFEVFRHLRKDMDFVSGDTGVSSVFAFPPFDCIDATTYYGGSLPLAIGAHLAGRRGVWAITGDYAFVAAGHMGLIEAVSRHIPLKVVVLHNGCAMTTGGQPLPDEVFDHVISGYRPYVTRIERPLDTGSIRSALEHAAQSDRLEIVVADYKK
ncbi:MAG: hypothetical protein JW736_02695 [Deltaproteobacteria bacterium]|nr:hypothetical protein [Deltaproteobacteria bacterium]